VTVRSGRQVVVFNIGGNKYRLITAIHYNRQLVFTLRVLTHAEYSRDDWKDVL
jgi:mRNA interferase HigB